MKKNESVLLYYKMPLLKDSRNETIYLSFASSQSREAKEEEKVILEINKNEKLYVFELC